MNSLPEKIYFNLNAPDVEIRLAAARELGEMIQQGRIMQQDVKGEVNNHVHTFYSFSPYSPSMAVVKAWQAGLSAVGIMDHDSVAGAGEMFQAGKAVGIATTAGFEVRVNMKGTAVEGRKINNPDSPNIAYMAVHGLPSTMLDEASLFLQQVNRQRNIRNRRQTENLNSILDGMGVPPLDFDNDVLALSRVEEGGSVTERHILFALARQVVDYAGSQADAVSFIEDALDIQLPGKIRKQLLDTDNPHYLYDLLGVLKGSFLPRFFIQPDETECLPVKTVIEFALGAGAIPAYAYLGDVEDSPTGDKKAEKFEDEYLDELIHELRLLGFAAVTYMPPRNTKAQLRRLSDLCRREGLMEISGVDINSSRQSFNCPEVMDPDFSHLIDATWALIAHERLASVNKDFSLFSENNPWASCSLDFRIQRYAEYGKSMDPHKPEQAALRIIS